MFSLAASAAATAAAGPPPFPKRNVLSHKTKQKKNEQAESRKETRNIAKLQRRSLSQRKLLLLSASIARPNPVIPGVKPILKRSEEDSISADFQNDSIKTSATEQTSLSFSRVKKVCFSTMEICEHAIQLGDHPYSEGAPVAMSDTCLSTRVFDVDEYELERDDRRQRKELIMSSSKRTFL
jgi:hypothetical protein